MVYKKDKKRLLVYPALVCNRGVTNWRERKPRSMSLVLRVCGCRLSCRSVDRVESSLDGSTPAWGAFPFPFIRQRKGLVYNRRECVCPCLDVDEISPDAVGPLLDTGSTFPARGACQKYACSGGWDLNLGLFASHTSSLSSHLHITCDGKRDIFLLK